MNLSLSSIPPETRRDLSLWAGMLAAPIAWFVQLSIVYALTPHACAAKGRFLLHLASLVCLAVAGFGLRTAWGNWEVIRRGSAADGPRASSGRARFQSLGGLLSGGLFLLIIVAEWLAISVLSPCVP
jgi:hypothetical protein